MLYSTADYVDTVDHMLELATFVAIGKGRRNEEQGNVESVPQPKRRCSYTSTMALLLILHKVTTILARSYTRLGVDGVTAYS